MKRTLTHLKWITYFDFRDKMNPALKLMSLAIGLWLLTIASASAQTTIKGVVISGEDNLPFPGVTVMEKGTTNGAVTDMDGAFSISINDPSSSTLVFSFIGFLTQEIQINNRSNIQLTLEPDVSQLDEVVVIGYGESKRRDLTGSVGSMNSENIRETNKVNAFQALQGQVAGVNIQATDNKPGGGFNVRIRGANTINANETVDQGGFSAGQNPLFIVDGIFVNDITFLNPSDIERMDVLKDASATAIYGSRGTNGVVIIETKKGAKGKLTVSYDNYVGVRQAYNVPNMLQGEDFLQYFRDAVVGNQWAGGNRDFTVNDVVLSDFMRPNELANVAAGRFTNWLDLVTETGAQQNHTVNLSGGNDNSIYGFGVAYTKDEGTFAGEDYERFNLRANVNANLSKYVSVGFSNYASFATRNEGSREGLRSAYRLRPTGSPFEEDGSPKFFPIEGETFITNPLFEPESMTMETRTLNYLSNLSLSVSPTKSLKFTSNFSPNIEFLRFGEYRGRFNKSTNGIIQNTRADVTNGNRISYTWDNIANYNAEFGKDHVINATFVYSMFMDRYENYRMQRRGFSTDQFLFYNMQAGPDIRDVTSGLSKQTLESYTARVNYNLKDKYLFTVTGRYDGSSILADNNKWAFFPSAAFAWRISDESFMKGQKLVEDLKMRVSYGETGNNGAGGGLGPLAAQSLVNNSSFVNLGGQPIRTAAITSLINRDLTWERTKEVNLGLDFGFFKNRVYGSVDVYNRNNTGIIFFRPTPILTGYSGVFENIGNATNRGIEVSLNSVNFDNGTFKWTSSLNFAANRNRITKLTGQTDEILFGVQGGSYIHRVGESIGSIFTWAFDGIWQLDELEQAQSFGQLPGQVRVKDINNDGVIDADDRTIIGNNLPDWTGGISNTFNYKNFDFTFFVHTLQGAISTSYFHMSHAGYYNVLARFNSLKTNYWTPNNPSNEWHQPSNDGPFAEPLIYRDVSFVKVGYITLGYNFNEAINNALKVQSLRLYFTAQNPFTFSSFEGWDPETAARNSWGSANLSRILMGGINVKF
ncbi:TonB-dependent receptor [Belliella sp. DSM 111904]|uniref:TonB-dependent receptor n=1 Tax=Belliella filtrata TaxID=2923435 RepID=A0ABS9UZS0_9BACT|nr:TonB-dependent receptor [Belliella filtrata]MCH7409455.1 TonB-dependent receptor [Belliella filtrata]